jgi:hypothetical protein
MKTATCCCCVALGLLLSGCAGAEPSISGTVKLDDKPLSDGYIQFIPIEDTPGPDAGAAIKDGNYQVVRAGLAGGNYRVSIKGYKESRRTEPDPFGGKTPVNSVVSIVPKKYNENSEEVRKINPGANALDFTLTTSGK